MHIAKSVQPREDRYCRAAASSKWRYRNVRRANPPWKYSRGLKITREGRRLTSNASAIG